MPLIDGTFATGQVIGKTNYTPTCVLFDVKANTIEEVTIKNTDKPAVTILHVLDKALVTGTCQIIGSSAVNFDPNGSPSGPMQGIGSKSWSGLDSIANAWFGLTPWNKYFKDDYLDQYLLPNIQRPNNSIMLSVKELENIGIKRAK